MGRTTYEQILSFGEWPYGDKPSWVLTRRSPAPCPPHGATVTLTDQSPLALVETLQQRHYQRIWLVGGTQLIAAFRTAGLIDEYRLVVIPKLLEQGIPLFQPVAHSDPLQLITIDSYLDGVVQLRYGSSNDCTRSGGQ